MGGLCWEGTLRPPPPQPVLHPWRSRDVAGVLQLGRKVIPAIATWLPLADLAAQCAQGLDELVCVPEKLKQALRRVRGVFGYELTELGVHVLKHRPRQVRQGCSLPRGSRQPRVVCNASRDLEPKLDVAARARARARLEKSGLLLRSAGEVGCGGLRGAPHKPGWQCRQQGGACRGWRGTCAPEDWRYRFFFSLRDTMCKNLLYASLSHSLPIFPPTSSHATLCRGEERDEALPRIIADELLHFREAVLDINALELEAVDEELLRHAPARSARLLSFSPSLPPTLPPFPLFPPSLVSVSAWLMRAHPFDTNKDSRPPPPAIHKTAPPHGRHTCSRTPSMKAICFSLSLCAALSSSAFSSTCVRDRRSGRRAGARSERETGKSWCKRGRARLESAAATAAPCCLQRSSALIRKARSRERADSKRRDGRRHRERGRKRGGEGKNDLEELRGEESLILGRRGELVDGVDVLDRVL